MNRVQKLFRLDINFLFYGLLLCFFENKLSLRKKLRNFAKL